jgi:protein SCO1/2
MTYRLILPLVLLLAAPLSTLARSEPLAPDSVVQNVAIDQKLGSQIPPDLEFRDENGSPVRLSQYLNTGRPVVLSLVYYRCPGLCTMTLNGMSRSFKPLQFSAGKEFEVVTVSIDPDETHQLASEKKAEYVSQYGRPGAAEGWHFLTGDEPAIRRLADAVGFRYVYDPNTNQYAHSAGIMVLTPTGRVARYFYGLEYSSRDLRWGLVEASENRIGSVADSVNLLCFAYDPMTGKYGVPVMRTLRVGALLTMATLGGFVFLMLRRDRRTAATGPAGLQSGISNLKSEISDLRSEIPDPQAPASPAPGDHPIGGHPS